MPKAGLAKLDIYNLSGQRVRRLLDGQAEGNSGAPGERRESVQLELDLIVAGRQRAHHVESLCIRDGGARTLQSGRRRGDRHAGNSQILRVLHHPANGAGLHTLCVGRRGDDHATGERHRHPQCFDPHTLSPQGLSHVASALSVARGVSLRADFDHEVREPANRSNSGAEFTRESRLCDEGGDQSVDRSARCDE